MVETGGEGFGNSMPSGFSKLQLAHHIGLPSSKSAGMAAGLISAAVQGWLVNTRCRDMCQEKSCLDASPGSRGHATIIAGRSAYPPHSLEHRIALDRHEAIDSRGEPYYRCLTSAEVLWPGSTQPRRHHPILQVVSHPGGSPACRGQSCWTGHRALEGQVLHRSDKLPIRSRSGHMEAK